MDILLSCIICLSFALFIIQAFRSFFTTSSKHMSLRPGPKPFPIIGNLLELGEKPHISLTQLSKRYGPIITLHLGQLTTIVVSSPSLAQQILKTHDKSFSNRTVPDTIHADHSLPFLPVPPTWRQLRTICNLHLFAPKILDANHLNRRAKVQKIIDDVKKSVTSREVVDIESAAFTTSLNLMSQTVFSVDLADASSETARDFKETIWNIMVEAGKPNFVDYFPWLRRIDPQGVRRRQTKYFKKLIELFDGMMDRRLGLRKEEGYVTCNDMLDTPLVASEGKREDMDVTHSKFVSG